MKSELVIKDRRLYQKHIEDVTGTFNLESEIARLEAEIDDQKARLKVLKDYKKILDGQV